MEKQSKFKRFIKRLVIVIASLVIFVYVGVFLGHKVFFKVPVRNEMTAEAIGPSDFQFGVMTMPQSESIEDLVDVYSEQMKRYSEIAPKVWPNGAPANQYTLLEEVNSKQFWLISPNGDVKKLDEKEEQEYNYNKANYANGFSLFTGKEIEGMYIAVDEKKLKNYAEFEGQYHLGTFDIASLYAHELFHLKTQMDWIDPDPIVNLNRNDRFEDEGAREKRYILMMQLMDAIAEPERQEEHILRAVSTYNDYKTNFEEDYLNSIYFDKIEGLAYYFELMTSPYMGYPDKVNSMEDIDRALTTIMSAKLINIYGEAGTVSESYTVGSFAGILLDRLAKDKGEDSNIWKEEMIENTNTNPMKYLSQKFSNAELPAPEAVNKEEYDKFLESEIKHKGNIPSAMFELFYDILYK